MKVCILGTAPGSRLAAPYDDPSFEIWVCSAGNSQQNAVPRVTKWFELHAICDMMGKENEVWCKPYFKWLRESSFPIYMQEKNDFIPQAIVFPYKRMMQEFGPNNEKGLVNWFTSSVAWMMAFAITQMREGDEIAIFGVDMAATEENYSGQKAGCQRFMEFAHDRGIKVTIPYESCLGKFYPLYGYAEATNMGRKLQVRKHEMTNIRQSIDAQVKQGELQRAFFDGAIEACNYDIRTWCDGSDAVLNDEGVNSIAFSNAMQSSAKTYAEERVPLTSEFTETSGGIFVPRGTSVQASAAAPGPTTQAPVESTAAPLEVTDAFKAEAEAKAKPEPKRPLKRKGNGAARAEA